MRPVDLLRGWLSALVIACPLSPSLAGAAMERPSGLYLPGVHGDAPARAPLLDTAVEITVSGMLARVEVEQRFENRSDDWVEGIYVFPLPDDAAVDRLRMHYAGRLVVGEIRERGQAREAYTAARDAGLGASLVEQERANLFTATVANIPPRESVTISIAYQHEAEWRDGGYSLRFPMVVAPRYVPGIALAAMPLGSGVSADTDEVPDASRITPPLDFDVPNPVSLKATLDVGLPLKQVSSPHHAIHVEAAGPGRYRVTLAEGEVAAERDFELRWQPATAAMPGAALFTEAWSGEYYGLLSLMPPPVADVAPAPRELILVIDTSGSMHGESIDQARAAAGYALRLLAPGDRFNLVSFNDRAERLFATSRPADRRHLETAFAYLAGLRAEGGTEMVPAMRLALDADGADGPLRQVVFLTDGAIGNEQALFEIIASDLGRSRLFPVGIGSAPNALLMRKAARLGRGTFAYIGASDEVAGHMQTLFRKLRAPVLTDIQVDWLIPDGSAVVDQVPARVADLYADEPVSLALRAPVAPLGVTVSGMLGGRPWRHTLDLRGGADAPGVHALWARRAIEDRLAAQQLGAPAEAVRAAVVDIALRHRIVSRFTSLVAVDRTPARPSSSPLATAAVPVRLPAGWSPAAAMGHLPGTATPAALALLLALVAFVVAALARRRW